MRISDWSSDVCSSDLLLAPAEVSVEVPHREQVVVDVDLAVGNVRGHVTYSDSTPVADAPISVCTGGSSSEPMVAARTYHAGSYRFGLEAGDHFIVADPTALASDRHVTPRRPLAVDADAATSFRTEARRVGEKSVS